jgi:hypothetical protein
MPYSWCRRTALTSVLSADIPPSPACARHAVVDIFYHSHVACFPGRAFWRPSSLSALYFPQRSWQFTSNNPRALWRDDESLTSTHIEQKKPLKVTVTKKKNVEGHCNQKKKTVEGHCSSTCTIYLFLVYTRLLSSSRFILIDHFTPSFSVSMARILSMSVSYLTPGVTPTDALDRSVKFIALPVANNRESWGATGAVVCHGSAPLLCFSCPRIARTASSFFQEQPILVGKTHYQQFFNMQVF